MTPPTIADYKEFTETYVNLLEQEFYNFENSRGASPIESAKSDNLQKCVDLSKTIRNIVSTSIADDNDLDGCLSALEQIDKLLETNDFSASENAVISLMLVPLLQLSDH